MMEQPVFYAAPDPYPTIAVKAPNLVYAQMLSSAFASAESELTTITQYLYFSWVIAPGDSDLGTMFRKISQVEMRHLNMLGQLITALGGNPVYRSYPFKRPIFWNSGMLQYQCNKEKALHISIAGEQTAIDGYQHLSKLIQDSCVTDVLQRIILDERIHIQLFQQYLSTNQTECKQ